VGRTQEHLYDGEPPTQGDWRTLRLTHIRLEQFYNALTFPDLILFATRAVQENSELVEDTLFIIDEFQDFNLAEDAFIKQLTVESPAQLLVGDDDQVLYDGLRRAHPNIIRGYYQDRSFTNAMLPFCGRCSIHICRTAEAFLARERSSESIRKVFLPLNREEADLVTVVATTSPKVGVQYVQDFLERHDAAIRQREEEIRAGSNKDAYLLILTPARKMKYLNVGGALDTLRDALSVYAVEEDRPGDDYWRLRDYYYTAVHPSQNYNVRKVLAHEQVEQDVVASLLREALDSGRNLADLEREVISAALEKCAAIREIVEADLAPADQAEQIAGLCEVSDPHILASDLERLPIRTDADADVESFDLEQKDVVSAVEVTTIVGAKGLSADHVIILGCDDVNLDRVTGCAFFVALTRARKSLTLMACVGGGGATVLHEFVCALPDEHTQAVYVKAGGVQTHDAIGELQRHLEKWKYAKSMKNRARAKITRS
jgi:superfamily I DNA/RNA helicase